jgi:hypothetical protein
MSSIIFNFFGVPAIEKAGGWELGIKKKEGGEPWASIGVPLKVNT